MDSMSNLGSIQKRWSLLARVAGFIVVVVAGFVKVPDVYDPAAEFATAKTFAGFIVAVMVGLSFYFSHNWSRKKDSLKWVIATVLFLILSITSYLISEKLKDKHTCRLTEGAVIIGTIYTEHGKVYTARHPDRAACETLLMDHGGNAYSVWTPGSISRSRTILIAAYLASFLLAALCILSVTQQVACVTAQK